MYVNGKTFRINFRRDTEVVRRRKIVSRNMEALGRALRSFHEKHEKIKHTVHTVRMQMYKTFSSHFSQCLINSDVAVPYYTSNHRLGVIPYQDGDHMQWVASISLYQS